MIAEHSRHTPAEKLAKKYSGFTVVDVTSRGPDPWVRLSPFFPHGGLRVPGQPGLVSASVEGAWQGLKVFEEGVDLSKLEVTSMKGLKRTVRRLGPCLGHRWGTDGLLGYGEARHALFLPLYRQLLEGPAADAVAALRALADGGDVVLLDYMTNCDVDDLSRPLSHAGLVGAWLEDRWPGR